MDNISFKSTIKPVSRSQFNKIVSSYNKKNFVDYPWTVKESILSDKVYTKGIEDCSFLGLTDGQKVLGLHLCPTMKENFDFRKIKEFIMNKIDLKNPNLQGILLGARRYSENRLSFNLFENLEEMLQQYNIPFSKFKDGKIENDIAYNSITDEWLVSSDMAEIPDIKKELSAEQLFDKLFEEVNISETDELSW